MLFTILISIVVVAVVFAIVNKFTKKTEQPVTLNDDGSKPKENPVVGPLEEGEGWGWKEVTVKETTPVDKKQPPIELIAPEIVIDKGSEVQPKPKAKKKMSAKPKTSKAPKKKKDA